MPFSTRPSRLSLTSRTAGAWDGLLIRTKGSAFRFAALAERSRTLGSSPNMLQVTTAATPAMGLYQGRHYRSEIAHDGQEGSQVKRLVCLISLAAAWPGCAQSRKPAEEARNLMEIGPSAEATRGEMRQIVDQLCPGHGFVGERNGRLVCPGGTSSAGVETESTIDSVTSGHFSSADQKDFLVALRGCEPHANGFTDRWVFTKDADGVMSFHEMESGDLGVCSTLTNSGRDGLLCLHHDHHHGIFEGDLSFPYLGFQFDCDG